MRQWILAGALAGAAHGAAGEVPDRPIDIADWVVNRATCHEILGQIDKGAHADFDNPTGTVMMIFMTYAAGYAAARNLTPKTGFLTLMVECVAWPDQRLQEVTRP